VRLPRWTLAGYPWLDQSTGADGMLFINALYGDRPIFSSIGSIRAPTAPNVLFSLRVSMDAASLQVVDITST